MRLIPYDHRCNKADNVVVVMEAGYGSRNLAEVCLDREKWEKQRGAGTGIYVPRRSRPFHKLF